MTPIGSPNPLWKRFPLNTPLTTGIGSLPHHNVDAALAVSFQLGIPFLPQIPIRNPHEFMIAQALYGLPGLQERANGMVTLDLSEWKKGTALLREKTEKAFSSSLEQLDAFEAFEPTSHDFSCWKPFLWELQERNLSVAKIQLAGPMTCQWAMRLEDQSTIDSQPEISSQIYRLTLARAVAMVRALKRNGVLPIFFWDEPSLFGLTPSDPKHLLGLKELGLAIDTLRKEGAIVGLHCCSNTHWKSVLELNIDILSLDTSLSLEMLLKEKDALLPYLKKGNRLCLGVIPTGRTHDEILSFQAPLLKKGLIQTLNQGLADSPGQVQEILQQSFYSPACGLALHSPEETEAVIHTLLDYVPSERDPR